MADLRAAHDHHRRTFDAVIACDNSLPHLLTDDDLLAALVQLRRATAPGGVCAISVRDYAALIAPASWPPFASSSLSRESIETRRETGSRNVRYSGVDAAQPDGRLLYDVTLYLLEDDPPPTSATTSPPTPPTPPPST